MVEMEDFVGYSVLQYSILTARDLADFYLNVDRVVVNDWIISMLNLSNRLSSTRVKTIPLNGVDSTKNHPDTQRKVI